MDLAGGQEGRLEQREDVDSPMTAAKSSQPPSNGGKLVSFCSTLQKTWFVKEFVMMFKLSIPLVSKRWREGQTSRQHAILLHSHTILSLFLGGRSRNRASGTHDN